MKVVFLVKKGHFRKAFYLRGMKMRMILFFLISTFLAKAQTPEKPLSENAIKDLYFSGLIEKLNGNLPKAESFFAQIVAANPNQDAAFFELASINIKQQKLLPAETNIKKAIALNPKNEWYMRLLVEIYKKNGNTESQSNSLNLLIALSPKTESYYFDKAEVLFLQGKKDSVKLIFQEIENRFGSSGKLSFARQKFMGADANQGVNRPQADDRQDVKALLAESDNLGKQGKYEQALKVLQKAKQTRGENYEISLAFAQTYQLQNKNELAEAALKDAFASPSMPIALKINLIDKMLKTSNWESIKRPSELCRQSLETNPEEVKLLILYGDVLYRQGEFRLAKAQYAKVIKLADKTYLAYEKLLGLQNLTTDYDEAVKTGEEALRYFPNQAIIYYYRAFALHRTGKNAEAAYELKTATELASDDKELMAMIYGLQAEVFIDQQKLKEADIAFEKSKELAPDNVLIGSHYAYYLALRGYNLPKAEQLAAKAAKALPENPAVADNYAFVLTKLNRLAEALVWQEKALKNNGDQNGVYLENYGNILFLKGDKEAALLQWQKAKAAGNNSQKLTQKINEKQYIK